LMIFLLKTKGPTPPCSILRFLYQKVGVSPWTSRWTLLRGSRFSTGTALELNLPLGKERGLELTWFNVPSNPLWD
jgi:hypothetical protein